MAAPLGNKFWQLRSTHGRDQLFADPQLLLKACEEYFQWVDDHPWIKKEQLKKSYVDPETKKTVYLADIPTATPYTIQGLCRYLQTNHMWFNQFEEALTKKDDQTSKDLSIILAHVRDVIYQQKFEGAAVGAFNANIIARDLGLADKKEQRDVDKNGNDIIHEAPIIEVYNVGPALADNEGDIDLKQTEQPPEQKDEP